MRNLFRSAAFPFFLFLAACNYPISQPSPMGAATEEVIPTVQPEPTPTKTVLLVPSAEAPTAGATPTSGPIPHLDAGTPLALSHIDMIDADAGWAIGGAADARLQDHVLLTGDGGSTWKDVTPPEKTVVEPAADRIAVGAFWDSETAWATFYSADLVPPPDVPVVWKTADGGATWVPSAPLDLSGWVGGYRVSDLFFININTGWVLAHKGDDPQADRIALFQTVNGGNTWQRVVDPAVNTGVQECEKTGIVFTGPWDGWMTGDCLGERPGVFLFQTFDGGKSWIEAKLPSPAAPAGMLTTTDFSCRVQPPTFFAQGTQLMLAVECTSKATQDAAAYLFSSNLDGSGWHSMTYPGGQLVVRSPGDGRVFRGDVKSGLVIGAESFIYNGETDVWETIDPITFTGWFDFIDWNKGWAAALREDTPLLMFTSDGGRTWRDLKPVVA
jgi:hypothetical protein